MEVLREMIGFCHRCLSSNVKVTLIDGKCYCDSCKENRNEEKLNVRKS